jgi:hypothetical protein
MEKIDGKNFKTHDVIFKKEEKDSFKQYKRQISKTNMLRQVFDLVTQAFIKCFCLSLQNNKLGKDA